MKKLKVVTGLLLIFTVSSVFADQVEKNEIGQARNAAAIVINTKTLQKLQKILPELPEVVDQDMAIILCPEKDTPQWGECLYEVGGTGPAGGLVFYTTDGGRHGIEASPTDQGQSEWGCYTVEVAGAESQEVGSGKTNTNAILDGGCVQDYVYSGDIAARIAYDYTLNGFEDWYLPSLGELGLMYSELREKKIGDFAGYGRYISSSQQEESNIRSWAMRFSNGLEVLIYRNLHGHVRPVRSF
ncbi:hypothetical protein BMR07_05525 [Methylococcaceae bacterium CS1]|nr:hypothetical protein BMR09_06870 [Methylococcaceae bacterium CS3]TXL07176.1 hypothetical protein BMR07_05525 [Methylococcaceae bacterium CS1]TXL09080.1 hypothetical protein BMR08_13690 [Methylococcaceae bacterium CS2]